MPLLATDGFQAERYLTSKSLELADKKDLEIVKIDRAADCRARLF